MRRPVGTADLVLDQQVGGFGIGHPQERLGKAEQRHPLGGVEPVLLEEAVDPALGLRGAQVGEQAERAADDGFAGVSVERRGREQPREHVGFGRAVEVAHPGAGGGEAGHPGGLAARLRLRKPDRRESQPLVAAAMSASSISRARTAAGRSLMRSQ